MRPSYRDPVAYGTFGRPKEWDDGLVEHAKAGEGGHGGVGSAVYRHLQSTQNTSAYTLYVGINLVLVLFLFSPYLILILALFGPYVGIQAMIWGTLKL